MKCGHKILEIRPSNVQVIDNKLIGEVRKFKEIPEKEGLERALKYARASLTN